jgi:4-amino-4-deoxy-L-arabinose transferase-like glycosyltransferase
MLTKGPVAVVLPALTFLLWLAVQRRVGDIRRMHLAAGVAIVIAIVAPWYVALYLQHGWEYIVGFFWGENVARYADAAAPERGLLFYPPVVFGDLFPWSLMLIPAAALAWRQRGAHGVSRLRVLLWLWIAVIVGFFSLSATKQDLYIFPIIVAVAALAGEVLDEPDRDSALTRWMLVVAGAALVALAVFIDQLFGGSGQIYRLAGVLPVVLIAAAAGVMTIAGAVRRRLAQSELALAACFIVLNWIFVLQTLPSFERYKPVVPMSQAIRARSAGHAAAVLHYNVALPSMVFYLQQHVEQIFEDPAALVDSMRKSKEYYVVLRASDYENLKAEFPGPTCVIDRRPLFEAKLKNVLAREPLPELLLVTNRCP